MSLKKSLECVFINSKHCLKQTTGFSTKPKTQISKYSTGIRSSEDEYIVRNPYSIEIPKKTYTELIWERHSKWKNNDAIVCGITNKKYTFTDLKEHSTIIGQCLVNEGINNSDVLAIVLPNSPEYINVILGASERGLTVCSINPLYTPDEISYQIRNSGAKRIVTFPEKVQDVMKAVDNLKMAKCLPPNFQILSIRVDEKSSSNVPKGIISLDDLVNKSKVTDGPDSTPPRISDQYLAFISHSSGTTGLPKGVCLTHRNIVASILQTTEKRMTMFKETDGNKQI